MGDQGTPTLTLRVVYGRSRNSNIGYEDGIKLWEIKKVQLLLSEWYMIQLCVSTVCHNGGNISKLLEVVSISGLVV